MDFSTLNWVEDSIINVESEYNVFQFDDLCSDVDCLLVDASESISSRTTLELKCLPALFSTHF